ncbi:MAG: N-acetyltransferase [Pseudomonadota bacterium]
MVIITPEQPDKHAEQIEGLFDRTFGPGHFAKTAERLREFNASLPEINRVGVVDGRVVGVARAWPIEVEEGGPAVFVGPVAVDPAYRGARLGLRILDELLRAAHGAAYQAAILIGAIDYFSVIGFRVAAPGQLVMPGPQEAQRLLICDLAGNAQKMSGRVNIAPAASRCGQARAAQSRV